MKLALGAAGVAAIAILGGSGAALTDTALYGVLAGGTAAMLGGSGLMMWRAKYTAGTGTTNGFVRKPRPHPSVAPRIPRGAAHPNPNTKPAGWPDSEPWPPWIATSDKAPPGSREAERLRGEDYRRSLLSREQYVKQVMRDNRTPNLSGTPRHPSAGDTAPCHRLRCR